MNIITRIKNLLFPSTNRKPFDLKPGDTLTFIASDFDIVSYGSGIVRAANYIEPVDCPVYRCLTRMGYRMNDISLGASYIQVASRIHYFGNINPRNIHAAAQAIHDGATSYDLVLENVEL